MKDTKERKQQLEAAISEALQREAERHEGAVENMHRLRTLRLARGPRTACRRRLVRDNRTSSANSAFGPKFAEAVTVH
jgi:hypothetical protein